MVRIREASATVVVPDLSVDLTGLSCGQDDGVGVCNIESTKTLVVVDYLLSFGNGLLDSSEGNSVERPVFLKGCQVCKDTTLVSV